MSEFAEKLDGMQRILNEANALKADLNKPRLETILAMPDKSSYNSSMFFGVHRDVAGRMRQVTLAHTETPQGSTVMFGVLPLTDNQNGTRETTGYVVDSPSNSFLQLMGEQPPVPVDTAVRQQLADMMSETDFSQPGPVREANARIESGAYPDGWFGAVGDNRPLSFESIE